MADSSSTLHAAQVSAHSRDERPETHRGLLTEGPRIDGLATWSWHIPSNTVSYSREWRHILLRPEDSSVENCLSGWWPNVHEDDVNPFLEAARDIVEGTTEHYRTLFRVQRADDSWAWLLSRGRVVEKDGDTPVLVRGALMDVSRLRQDVKFQHGNTGMTAPRFHALSGVTPPVGSGETRRLPAGLRIARGSEEIVHPGMEPEQRLFLRNCIQSIFDEGNARRELASFATDYGHDVTGEYFFWPEFDEEGKVAAVMVQFWDVTDRMVAERRARLNEMRLDASYRLTQMTAATEEEVLAFTINSLVDLTGSDSGFLFFPENPTSRRGRMFWSRNARSAARFTPGGDFFESTLPRELFECTFGDNGVPFQKMIRNGNCLQPMLELFNGKVQVFRYIVVPVYEEGELVCVAGVCNKAMTEYGEDDLQQVEALISGARLVIRRHESIRELERAKEAAERAREVAERANKVKDEFLANVSHELRTPLNGMLSMLQLLDLQPLNGQQREYVRTASISGKALLRIISDILDFSRIESGKMKLQVEPFDFRSAFESSLGLFAQEAAKQGLSFDVAVGEGIPHKLLGDDARVRQILFNIVGNALKFTEKGGIRVECSVLPHGGPEDIWMYLAVRDTGIGIPEEDQLRIFEAFTQIDSSSTRKYKGTGLGLSIVRHLVGLMGGGITVESAVGEGTTVHCSLRFARAASGIAPDAPPERYDASALEKPLYILVAEDDDVSRFAIQSFLQKLGHRPVCVSNGRLALEMLQLRQFDCIFTDIQMPDMDGLEVARRIREGKTEEVPPTDEARALLRAAIPGDYETVFPMPRDVIMVTVSAHTMRGDRERFLEAGMDHYIAKPVVMKELKEVLEKITTRVFIKPF